MVDAKIQRELLGELDRMSLEQQRQVLEYAHVIGRDTISGKTGAELLSFAGILSPAEADRMAKVIEQGCEVVNEDEWRLPS
jgi:hypothetical protein